MTPSRDTNITMLLDQAAQRNPARAALVFGEQALSFGDLSRHVKQCAALFEQRGLKPGDRVILMIPMSPALYVAMLALIRCGAAAVFVDPWISASHIAAFSAFAQPRGFIGVPRSHLLRLMKYSLARLTFTASTGPTLLGLPARFSLNALPAQPTDHAPQPVLPDDPALITFTSGSSGVPKGANRTHAFLRAQYEALCQELDYRDSDVDMPMFPVFALRNLAAGITSVIPSMDFKKVSAIDAPAIAGQIKRHGVTLVTASAPFIDQLAALPSPPALRKIFTGGSPVSAGQLHTWHTAFPSTAIDIIYGSTEAEPVAHLSSHERLAHEAATGFCCGQPTALLKTRIVAITKKRIEPDDLDALTLPTGQTGELLVAGRHVCRDYFNNPEAVRDNKVMAPDGTCWHRMGDTGYLDAEGRFFLTGRVHSSIMRNGTLLQAQLIEAEIARQLPGAKRVAALEEEGTLLVVIQGDPPDPAPALDADRVIFTRQPLPLDPRHNSKIDYARLRRLIKEGRLT